MNEQEEKKEIGDNEIVLWLEKQLEIRQKTIQRQQDYINQLENENRQLNDDFNTISNAFFWKISKPIRYTLDCYKRLLTELRTHRSQIRYHVDYLKLCRNKLLIKGWIFDQRYELDKLELILRNKGKQDVLDISRRGYVREDVMEAYNNPLGLRSGFSQSFFVKAGDRDDIKAFLRYMSNNRSGIIRLGKIEDCRMSHSSVIESDETMSGYFRVGNWTYEALPQSVDIIVPVYNGYQYLEKLFEGLKRTDQKHRIILIDDNSSDIRILPFLEKFANERKNVIVRHNTENLGFVKTVNIGLKMSKHHVVIVNTDVELPHGWIERLMKPIFDYGYVASATPFSNCATIFSFPEFGDNLIYRGMCVDELDQFFCQINPKYTIVPTGVGFCMGVSRNALKKIGIFDEELFSRGYGEENDWCQRAIRSGFVNVHVENLFVYHKHGGSFLSDEKKRLMADNLRKLSARYPDYLLNVEQYYKNNPLENMKLQLRLRISVSREETEYLLVFTHTWGGGADLYLKRQEQKWSFQGKNVLKVQYDESQDAYQIICNFQDDKITLLLDDLNQLQDLINTCPIKTIVINELTSFPAIFKTLDVIENLKMKKQFSLVMLLHDYYSVSPNYTLVSSEDYIYSFDGSHFHCDKFYDQEKWAALYDCPTIDEWRRQWESFLLLCDEVRVFSEDSKRILSNVYPTLNNINVVPHVVDYIRPVYRERKMTSSLNIGVLGSLSVLKGKRVIQKLLELIERENRNIKIILIGEEGSEPIPQGKFFEKTGKYFVEDIPFLTLEKDIDVFLLPSICPETFSYTAEEIMKMRYPIACFNLGAPAERIADYPKGCILSSKEPDTILKEIFDFLRNLQINIPE